MLRECAQRLLETADLIRDGVSGATTTTSTVTTSAASRPAATSTAFASRPEIPPSSADGPRPARLRNETVRDEHNRLFGYQPPSRARQQSRPANRRHHPYSGGRSNRGSNTTWTRSFIGLASAGQQVPPTAAEKIELTLTGLGEKKISFPNNGKAVQIHEKVIETFPALEAGYEILRSGDGRAKELILIPMPPNGFTVEYLRSVMGQAKGYIRPLQRDIFLPAARSDDGTSCDKVRDLFMKKFARVPESHSLVQSWRETGPCCSKPD